MSETLSLEAAALSQTNTSTAPPGINPDRNTARFGLRLRAILVAIPLLLVICAISLYADLVSITVQFGVLQLAPPAVAALFGLVLCNNVLSRALKRELLNQADVLIIYAMLLVGVMVSTRGVIEKLVPPLAYLPYYASPENKLGTLITRNLPGWAMPFTPGAGGTPDGIRQYYEALPPGGSIPWNIWIGPLCAWFALIACVILVFLCVSTLLRRQWMDNEQLRFPLTILPLAMIRNEVEGQPFFTNRVMWMGFCTAAFVFLINGLHSNFPDWPRFVLDLNLGSLFTERPWNGMEGITLYLSLAAVGFAYFLPKDLLFSLWFFFLLTRVQDIFAVSVGAVPKAIGTHNARIWTGYQVAGAYFVLVAAQIRIGWPYFRQVWKTAFGLGTAERLDDSGELMSYRSAIIGVVVGFGGIVLWLTLAGMNPLLAAAQMGIYLFFIAVIMSRAVAEAGLIMTETSFLPEHVISLVYPMHTLEHSALTAQDFSILAMTNIIFTRDMRGVLLSLFLDDAKMAGELKVRQRSMLLPLLLAIVIAFVAAAAFFLYLSYTKGHLSLYQYPNGNAGNLYNRAAGQIQGNGTPPDATAYGGFAVGIVTTIILVYMRSHFAWFPLNPLAYAIAPTWAMFVLWFPFFIAWIVKSLVMRFGGIEVFRKIAPFMLGMILGEFSAAVFWAVMNMWKGWSAPGFPWP